MFVNGFGWQTWSEQQPTTYYEHQVKVFIFFLQFLSVHRLTWVLLVKHTIPSTCLGRPFPWRSYKAFLHTTASALRKFTLRNSLKVGSITAKIHTHMHATRHTCTNKMSSVGKKLIFPCIISSECHHIPESRTNYRLEKLTPGAKYNITLASATQKGEGPKARSIINTLPEKHQEISMTSLLEITLPVKNETAFTR